MDTMDRECQQLKIELNDMKNVREEQKGEITLLQNELSLIKKQLGEE